METMSKPITHLSEMCKLVFGLVDPSNPMHLLVAPAPDSHIMEGIKLAVDSNLVKVTFVGDQDKINEIVAESGMESMFFDVVAALDDARAIYKAAELAKGLDRVIFLPGFIPTADYFHHLFGRESTFLRRSDFLSLIGVMDTPGSEHLFLVSDVGLVPDPTVDQGVSIIKNAVDLARILGKETVRVGLLAFEENPTPQSPTTIAESIIAEYFKEKGDPTVCVEGPIRLDMARSDNAMPCIPSPHMEQGPADVLITNNIHVGNSMYKAMVTLCKIHSAPVVMGGAYPIALPSSSESAENYLNSIALCALIHNSGYFESK